MAAYSYKEVCYLPEIQPYVDSFEQRYDREFDGGCDYDGDYWLVASDYITDLVAERDRLRQQANPKTSWDADGNPLNLDAAARDAADTLDGVIGGDYDGAADMRVINLRKFLPEGK